MRCYHCKGNHETVSQVRECATVPAASVTVRPFAARKEDPITEKQLNFVRSLVARKDISKMVDEIPSDQPTLDGSPTDLEAMPKQAARFLIDALLGLNDKPQAAEKVARQLPDVPAGYYAIDGNKGEDDKFYRVDRPTQGKWAGRTFLKVQASDDFHAVRNQAEVARVLLEIAVDSEAAQRRYGQKIGRCGVCNRTLTDDTSREMGIGPICRDK
jgi:hypothetical protein